MRKKLYWGASIVGSLLLGGFFVERALRHPRRLAPVPRESTAHAVIPGIPGARYLVGVDIEPLVQDVVAARQREEESLARSGHTGPLPPADMLAISGGGDSGAFGAGLLCGWSASGNRPRFKSVTGVSTGALIAPLAFLGSEYDELLKKIYTSVRPADILEKRTILAAVNNDGMADNRPLGGLISRSIGETLLSGIAEEHEKGRILLVGTTNLDARQPVIWNMGKIAASGAPNALELCWAILLASAAIPGAFPPSMVRVEVDGKQYEEMHVDGGASAQVFLFPPSMTGVARSMGMEMTRAGRVYVIRNSMLTASGSTIERRTISIAGRAIESLIHTQGLGDLYRIYVTAQREGFDFNLAYIGPDFTFKDKEEDFDTLYMKALFDYGYNLGREGYPWKKSPPGLETQLGL
ncbi:MAG TPA: patatin-like phospholipase family protein [Candidatus Methylomirabilis sp.]|nr:patatin-like phospholipase family protein [Candidatus Methylomirabilis sp.]